MPPSQALRCLMARRFWPFQRRRLTLITRLAREGVRTYHPATSSPSHSPSLLIRLSFAADQLYNQSIASIYSICCPYGCSGREGQAGNVLGTTKEDAAHCSCMLDIPLAHSPPVVASSRRLTLAILTMVRRTVVRCWPRVVSCAARLSDLVRHLPDRQVRPLRPSRRGSLPGRYRTRQRWYSCRHTDPDAIQQARRFVSFMLLRIHVDRCIAGSMMLMVLGNCSLSVVLCSAPAPPAPPGTITVTFTITEPNNYLVHISLRKKPICFSPYYLTVLSGTPNCILLRNSLVLSR